MLVSRESLMDNEEYAEIFAKEPHSHAIMRDDKGTVRWVSNPNMEALLDKISLNDLIPLMCMLGLDKNSEQYRLLYRSMGYSLNGYWEIFYWDVNNKHTYEYKYKGNTK